MIFELNDLMKNYPTTPTTLVGYNSFKLLKFTFIRLHVVVEKIKTHLISC